MTTNYQIENYFKKNPSKNFKGVYASNEISSLKLPKNSSIIVNYSPNYARGSHWIAMKHLNDKKQPPEYFDSYGFIPDHDDKIIGVKTNFKVKKNQFTDGLMQAMSEYNNIISKEELRG